MSDSIGSIANSPASSVADVPIDSPNAFPQPPFRAVEKWDCHRTTGIPPETVEAATNVHRPFARGFARSLAAYLRSVVELEPSGERQTTYKELAPTLTPATLTIALPVESQPYPVLVLVETAIATPCLDLLLGGSGEKPPERNELTDVDVQVFAELSRMVARELQIAWQDLNLHVGSQVSVGKAARRAIPATGKVLILDFAMKIDKHSGTMSLLLAAPLVETMVQAMEVPVKLPEAASRRTIGKEFDAALGNVSVSMELVLPLMQVQIGDLVRLAPNSVLVLPLRASQPARLAVAGREIFSAVPARSGTWRAAKIETILKTSDPERAEPQ